MLDPFWMNKTVAETAAFPLPIHRDEVAPYLAAPMTAGFMPPEKPLAIQPSFNSKRLSAQQGQFTIHGWSRAGLETYPLGRHLVCIRLEGESVDRFKYELATAGVTELTISPDLVGLCRQIRES